MSHNSAATELVLKTAQTSGTPLLVFSFCREPININSVSFMLSVSLLAISWFPDV